MTDVPETRWARTVDDACIASQDVGQVPLVLLAVHGRVSHPEVCWGQPFFVRLPRRLSRSMRVLVCIRQLNDLCCSPAEASP